MIRKEKIEELNYYMELFKTIKKEKVTGHNFIKVETYLITLNTGDVIKREKITKGGKDGSASIILPITSENEFLVAIEPRVFLEKSVGVNFPAGYIEDEDPLVAAKRELYEETGYTSDDFKLLGRFNQDCGCSKALNSYFLATNCYKIGNQSLDKDEFIKYMLYNKEEIEYLIKEGYMSSLNSAYAFEKAKQYIKEKL